MIKVVLPWHAGSSDFRVFAEDGTDITKYFECMEVTVNLKTGRSLEVTFKCYADQVNIEVLKEHATVIVEEKPNE